MTPAGCDTLFDPGCLGDTLSLHDHRHQLEIYAIYRDSLVQLGRRLEPGHIPDRKAIRLEAHRLKSSSALVGAKRLASCLDRLEHAILDNSQDLLPIIALTRSTLRQTLHALQSEIAGMTTGRA